MLYVDSLKLQSIKRKHQQSKSFKFKVGDFVRISSNRRTFQRDYEQKWTEEIFIIRRRYLRQGIAVYKVVHYEGDSVEGTFYSSE
jgi:ribosomal protein L19